MRRVGKVCVKKTRLSLGVGVPSPVSRAGCGERSCFLAHMPSPRGSQCEVMQQCTFKLLFFTNSFILFLPCSMIVAAASAKGAVLS